MLALKIGEWLTLKLIYCNMYCVQVARLRVSQGWEFMGEYDEDFVKRWENVHVEVFN